MSNVSENIADVISNTTDYNFLLDYKNKITQQYTDKATEIATAIAKLTPLVDLFAMLSQAQDMLEAAQNEYNTIIAEKDLVLASIESKLEQLGD